MLLGNRLVGGNDLSGKSPVGGNILWAKRPVGVTSSYSLRDLMFSHFDTIPVWTDGQTDGRTQGYTAIAYTARPKLAPSHGKNENH